MEKGDEKERHWITAYEDTVYIRGEMEVEDVLQLLIAYQKMGFTEAHIGSEENEEATISLHKPI